MIVKVTVIEKINLFLIKKVNTDRQKFHDL